MLPLGRWVLLLPPLLLPVIVPSSGFFGWLTRSASPTVPQEATPELRPPPHVPFEMTTADERFLAGAQLQLSALDSCHHKVIAEVRSSCAELTEEELAKLGVSLFNCQASAEGRKTYLCTEDMTIAECTSPMDPDTWNAYHVISNRARAVCYATRQLQFKRQAEHTVNALVSTAASQLEAMQLLKTGQDELKSLTSEALQKVASSQQELLAQQAKLQGGQQEMEDAIHSNLGQLAQEKALIASGHQQVAQLIEGITRRMENVSHHLDHQDMDLQEGHQTILKDLNQMQAQAQEVFSKMETNLGLFLAYQNQTALYYEELMRKLQRMNESLGLVLHTMERMQKNVEGQLQHIQRFINWAGFSLSSIYTCVLHGSYFLLAALILSFLQIPGFPRAVLLVLVVANALSELNHAVSLGFKSLTSLLGLSVAGNWLLGCLCSRVQRGRREKPRVASLVFPGKQEERCAQKGEQTAARSRSLVTSTPDRETDVDLLSGVLEKLEGVSHSSDGLDLGRESLVLGENYFPEGNGTPLYGNWKPHLNTSPCPMNPRHPAAPPSIKQEDTLQSLRHPHHLGLPFRTLCDSRASSLNQSSGSDLSACSMTLRPFCQGITRTGQQCRKKVSPGNTFCHIHASGQSSYIG